MRRSKDISHDPVRDFGARCPIFTLTGNSPGPRLVVVGDETVLRAVADLAWQMQNLVSVHGALVLRDARHDLGLDRADVTLRLDDADTDPQQVFDRILRRMTALHMLPVALSSAA